MALRKKLNKMGTIIGAATRRPHEIREGMVRIYNNIKLADSPIPSKTALELVGGGTSIILENWTSVDGNVSVEELAFLCALARKMQPNRVVEIGTFDGNTTLQLALNTPPDSRIFTLDLPVGAHGHTENDPNDLAFIASQRRVQRRFLGTAVEHKIRQYYGDSLTYDFAEFAAEGDPQFVFIDAGHSYKCVRNDTEKTLNILDRNGIIVWHDYGTWPDVYQYLVELSHKLSLIHIAGTRLVVYQAAA